jgi:histidine ammonia-lyase
MDRQFALLVDTKFSNGLPSNLSGMENDPSHHGFKALQVGVSAWTAEALKNQMPASVFSRSTECHNQDKVSMGTIAALDCVKIIRLVTQVAAASLLASFQALNLRLKKGELKSEDLGQVKTTYDEIAGFFAPIEADRQMEGDLRRTMELIKGRYFNLD